MGGTRVKTCVKILLFHLKIIFGEEKVGDSPGGKLMKCVLNFFLFNIKLFLTSTTIHLVDSPILSSLFA